MWLVVTQGQHLVPVCAPFTPAHLRPHLVLQDVLTVRPMDAPKITRIAGDAGVQQSGMHSLSQDCLELGAQETQRCEATAWFLVGRCVCFKSRQRWELWRILKETQPLLFPCFDFDPKFSSFHSFPFLKDRVSCGPHWPWVLCSPKWSWPAHCPTSNSPVLRLQVCATMPSLCRTRTWTQASVHANQTLSRVSYIPNSLIYMILGTTIHNNLSPILLSPSFSFLHSFLIPSPQLSPSCG